MYLLAVQGLFSEMLSCSFPCVVFIFGLGYLAWLSWLKERRLQGHILAPFPTSGRRIPLDHLLIPQW